VDSDKPLAPMSWAQRLKRVFAIDIETCPDCGGKLRVIA
jgi:rRNA maturation protein Nop10